MNTETGEIYRGEKKSDKDVSLTEEQAKVYQAIPEDQRVEVLMQAAFDVWYNKADVKLDTFTKMKYRSLFRAGWTAREKAI